MIPGLKTIHTHNIQSHKDVVIELPKTGIVAFTGNNSNGKSVIVKVINAILRNDLTKPKERRTLINKEVTSGYVELIRYDGLILHVNISTDAAATWCELIYPDGTNVKRYLADKVMPELVREFGLNYNKEFEISLNVHNDDDKFLFVNTKHQANYAALNSALTDEYAENAYTKMEEVLKEVVEAKRALENELNAQVLLRQSLPTYDVAKCKDLQTKLQYIAANMKHVPTEPCPRVHGVPDVTIMPTFEPCPKAHGVPSVVTMFVMPPIVKVHHPLIINLPKKPDNATIKMLGNDVNDILKGVCPTCKRAFFS